MSLTTSPLIISLSIASVAFSIATNAVTTLLIVYKLWYVVGGTHLIQRLTMERNFRSYLTFIVKTLGLRGRTSPAQTILIILVESGLVYLGIQVGHFLLCFLMCVRTILIFLIVLIDSLLGFDPA